MQDDRGRARRRAIRLAAAQAVVAIAELFASIAANPFPSFTIVAAESGGLVFTSTDDSGRSHSERAVLAVV